VSAPTADPAAFRRLMARWATGVSVVTAREAGRDHGMTANSPVSVSLAPPLLLVSLSADADTTGAVERSGAFGVSLLAADQRPLSERFARAVAPEEKFRDLAVTRGPLGPPRLSGALGWVECRVRSVTPAADHRLVLGEVEAAELGPEALPLIFYHSGYAAAAGPDLVRLPPPRTP
jgi:3-hydroxy-9,10-secoandrosta-1,3,5(10)-triene-9,17-dione monooxygenase reductase component